MFWWANLLNIWFLEPRFMKYEKTSFNVETYMSFMHSEPLVFFLPRLPLSVSRSAASTGHVNTSWNSKIKYSSSHKNTLVNGSFLSLSLSLSHLIPIPLIFLHSVTVAIWASHKNSVADDSFFHLSHLIHIPLICLHSFIEVIWVSHKNSVVNDSTP